MGSDLQLTRIDRVEPERLSLCGDDLHLLVYGANIWRSTDLFMNGVAAEDGSIRVLPDMEGVRATFDVKKVQETEARDEVNLLAWTRDGFDERRLIVERASVGGACLSSFSERIGPGDASIRSVTPRRFSACQEDPSFLIEVEGLGSTLQKAFLGAHMIDLSSTGEALNVLSDGRAWTVIQVKGGETSNPGATALPLVLVGENGDMASVVVHREGEPKTGCKSKPVQTAAVTVAAVFTGAGKENTTHNQCQATAIANVRGTGLDAVKKVTLADVPGTIDASGRTKTFMPVTFKDLPTSTQNDPVQDRILRLQDDNGKDLATTAIKTFCLPKA